jgi:hypothetical protein
MDTPRTLTGPFDRGAEGPHDLPGIDHILALEEPGNAGFADRERAKDQGAVGDRLVARDAHTAPERA